MVISDASATEPPISEKLYTSVNVPSVAGVTLLPNELPKVPEAGGVIGGLTAGAGERMTGAATAAVEPRAIAATAAAVTSNLRIATSTTYRSEAESPLSFSV